MFETNEEKEVIQAFHAFKAGYDAVSFDILYKFLLKPAKQIAACNLHGLSGIIRGAFDEEDIVCEVFSDFFKSVKEGRYRDLEGVDDLLGILRLLIKSKIHGKLRLIKQMNRCGDGKKPFFNQVSFENLVDPKSNTDQPVIVEDQLQCLLDDELRAIAVLKLEGYKPEEIAQHFGHSVRWVNSQIKKIQQKFVEVIEIPKDPEVFNPELFLKIKEVLQQTNIKSIPKTKNLAAIKDEMIDPVDCTVFAPPRVCAGYTFMVQVMVHLPSQGGKAKKLAKEFDTEAERRGYTSLGVNVERGSRLMIDLSIPGLEIDQRLRCFTWQGRMGIVQFRVGVPRNHPSERLFGTVMVSQEQIPLGQITFKLDVDQISNDFSLQAISTDQVKVFESFFISYASEDRPEVLKRCQMLKRLGKSFFQDLLDLDPGDRWEQKLYRKIDECDAVLLFWSSKAKESKYVIQECQYTIANKGLDHLLPVIIEGPPPVKLPPELGNLHMNDWLLYVIDADSRSRNRST